MMSIIPGWILLGCAWSPNTTFTSSPAPLEFVQHVLRLLLDLLVPVFCRFFGPAKLWEEQSSCAKHFLIFIIFFKNLQVVSKSLSKSLSKFRVDSCRPCQSKNCSQAIPSPGLAELCLPSNQSGCSPAIGFSRTRRKFSTVVTRRYMLLLDCEDLWRCNQTTQGLQRSRTFFKSHLSWSCLRKSENVTNCSQLGGTPMKGGHLPFHLSAVSCWHRYKDPTRSNRIQDPILARAGPFSPFSPFGPFGPFEPAVWLSHHAGLEISAPASLGAFLHIGTGFNKSHTSQWNLLIYQWDMHIIRIS